MPTDEVRRTLQVATIEVQIAAAEGGASNFEDRIGWILEFGVRAVFDGDLWMILLASLC